MVVFLKVKADNGMGQVGTQTGTIRACAFMSLKLDVVLYIRCILFCSVLKLDL